MPIKINPIYEYRKLSRIEGPQRLYATPEGDRVPSVTTILGETADKTALMEWRRRVGDAEANRISQESAGLGTLVHKHIENYIEGAERPKGNNQVHQMARMMSDAVINQGLADVDEIWGMEASLYYPGLYAGTTDLVGIYKGQPAIMDHKTTKLMKKREWIDDYFIQTAAYALAHNEIYGTSIKTGAIFMTGRDGSYKTFVVEGAEFDHYIELWLQRVEQYYNSR